ncbi:MAG: hypothetical protein Q9M31_02990 [Mariprofundus sp.]|nr:hypothetical protein [Mariprofundus sp.]
MKKIVIMIAGLMLSAPMALAHGDEKHAMDGQMMGNPCSMQGMKGMHHNPCDMGSHHADGKMGMMKGAYLVKKEIDGYSVSFHIMKAKKGMENAAHSHASGMHKEGQDGPSHHVMIKVEKDGKTITDLVANSKVVHPNGKSESKLLMQMGDWYMAAYDLNHPGKHQLMLLFKTADGVKHFGGINYPKPAVEASDGHHHQH